MVNESAVERSLSAREKWIRFAVVGLLVPAVLYAVYRKSPVLSHDITEMFSVIVACGLFMVTWNARRFIDNHYFVFLGIAYLFVGAIDYLHTLSFASAFSGESNNFSIGLWFAARYLQSFALLAAPLFASRKIRPALVLAGFAAATILLVGAMHKGYFLDFYVLGVGLTPAKALNDHIVSALQLLSIGVLWRVRERFDRKALRLLILSVLFSVAAEMSADLYRDAYLYNSVIGHYLKVVSFYLVYDAVITTGLIRPYSLLFRNLKRSEEELRAARDGLESRVAERAAELRAVNERLERELAERKVAEEALRESEDRFRSLVENAPVGILIVREGRILYRNPVLDRLFGEIQDGARFRDLGSVHPGDKEKFERLCEAIEQADPGWQATELRFSKDEGDAGRLATRWLFCQTGQIEFEGRASALVVLDDMTRMKDLEQIVSTREKLSIMGQMAAGIAHEIRNPLSGININVSTLEHVVRNLEAVSPEERRKIGEIVAQAKGASEKIATVIRRVMDFTKPVPPKLDRVDVNQVVREALEFSSATLRKVGISVGTQLSPGLPRCFADPRLLEQVLLNLITNAVQAMEGGNGRKRLGLATAQENGTVLIRVFDNGPGIPVHLRERIFDPFYTTRKTGHGIGLSFSHRVIENHGGTLTASGSEWGGAEFRIALRLETGGGAG